MTTENVMKAKEIIAVLEAYINGEEIEFSGVDTYSWVDMTIPEWNFKKYKYRIKPIFKEEKIEPKFKKGDTIVHKELCDGTPLDRDSNFLVVDDIDLSKEKYRIYNNGLAIFEFFDIEEIDEDYLNIDDCLLYWEYYDDNYEAFTKTDLRYDKEDCIDYLHRTTSYLTPTPIYQLGARLKKGS
ncbi:Uncharacterised protein [Campylobacter hyointestinalis subsp. hyointestinalis]|uniref:Uncharacterized protein n=1 Tax=Campylobacter hyointestinalis subsp. hyointestinalis TaxID=91352 RepID=A0A9W5ERF2_CAMHY|nr:hypothetical protein [Campylobacter hyointestinalis]CUU77041.1 Uncharacterised protein [Campylobacter hyointestinalis subsp. hyointestinalis]